MHSPTVQLPSGGSIVIHTTEALTAIDVNSGRSTRERHIDETAVKTNLEAADEVARQLRLRDLAGLVVIDFIDMSEGRHQRAVEKRLRDALKADRARIQIGRISQFGLMELSRQRLRASLQELSSQVCPHCAGLGVVRSTESCALQTLRAIQEAGIRGDVGAMVITAPGEVALYLLNQKREALSRLEQRYAMHVTVQIDPDLVPPAMRLEITEKRDRDRERERADATRVEHAEPAVVEEPIEDEAPEEVRPAARSNGQRTAAPPRPAAGEEGEEGGGRRRRKRRRRRRRPSEVGSTPELAAAGQGEFVEDGEEAAEPSLGDDADAPSSIEVPAERVAATSLMDALAEAAAMVMPVEAEVAPPAVPEPEPAMEAVAPVEEPPVAAKPKRPRAPRKPRAPRGAKADAPVAVAAAEPEPEPGSAPAPNGADHDPAEEPTVEIAATLEPEAVKGEQEALIAGEAEFAANDAEDRPQRQGWWSRWVR